jgi:hypoxia up-regulated 1
MFSKAIAILCYTILFIETFTSAQLIGIDTGSQFFKVALVKPGSPFQIVTNVHSKRKTETILGFEDAERRFGGDAVTLASRRPKQAISFVPRLLGRSIKHKTVESFSSQYLPFGIDVDDSRGTVNLTAIGGGNTAQKDISLSPEEAMAMILTHAKSNADRFSGGKVTDAVLTVPSYFTVSERDSMRDAAHIAGLKVLSLIEENTAAALQYGISRIFPNETHTVLIYNMGASSTQVSIFDFTTYVMKKGSKNQTFGQFQTVGKAWDEYLGGFAYDLKLVEFMADEFNKMKIRKGKKDVRQTPRAMAKIRKSAEKVKKVLSANKKYPITIESLCDDMDFRGTTITREQFETLASDLFERVLTPVEKALEMANKTIDQITQVEIVGGGVRIPKVQELLADFFKLDSVSALGVHLNGDEAMALGAAFRAANMSKAFRVGRAERSVGMIESSYFPIGLRLEELPEKIVEVSEEKEAGDGDAVGEAVSDAASADESIQKKKWSKRVSLFSRKSELLKKKKIKLTHDHDFSVTLKYDSHSKVNMDEAIDLVFREFNITGLEKFAKGDKKHLGTPQVELVFQLDSNGVPQISKAEAKLEEIVIVEEPKEEIKKEKEGEKEGINDTDVKDNQEEDKKKEEIKSEKKDEESEEEKKEEGGKEEKETEEKKDKEEKKVDEGKKDEEAKQEKEEGKKDGKEEGEIEEGEKKDGEKEQPKKKKTKKRIHRIQLNVVPVVSDAQSLHRMTIKQTNDASRRLRDMEAADELRQKRDAAKNSLESFVFELRGQVRDNEENLSKVSPVSSFFSHCYSFSFLTLTIFSNIFTIIISCAFVTLTTTLSTFIGRGT